jgi:hypothetical protein
MTRAPVAVGAALAMHTHVHLPAHVPAHTQLLAPAHRPAYAQLPAPAPAAAHGPAPAPHPPAPGKTPAPHGKGARGRSSAPPRAVDPPAPPLPMLPSIARVRVEAARDRVVVVEDVSLPRDEWRSGGLHLYAAFGEPGTPLAVDAHLVPVAPDAMEARVEDVGEPVTVEPAVHHTPSTQLLLGRPTMAGVAIHVPEAALRRAYETSDRATLRIRSLLAPPAADAAGGRDVVVRLGIDGGRPLTLDRVQVVSTEAQPWITRAEARLCGPQADPWPLAVSIVPRPATPTRPWPPPIVPTMAVRHSSDDLCVRWWATP